jgi:uncharacterized protein YbjT (DUF2867 family)
MRVLIVGASGLIGSAVAARLMADGHAVTAAARHPPREGLGAAHWLRLDLAATTQASDLLPHLAGIDAVINCAGTLQDQPGNSTFGVHATGAAALFAACERAGVRRVIQVSAVGTERATPTAFSRSKRAGDEALMARDLDWIILRPSLVFGRTAYGGSALLRGLAALPLLPVMPHTAPLQIVHLDDLIDAIVFFLAPTAPSRRALDVVGPKAYRFEEAVALLRRWMRYPPARPVRVPAWLAAIAYRAGDLVGWLGWQPPVRSTTATEIARGGTGDPASLAALTGMAPRDLDTALMREPASVQERWFARLYFLKAATIVVFSLFWIATGIVSLGPGFGRGVDLVMQGGTGRAFAVLATITGALADIAIGAAIAHRRTHRLGLYAALAISATYAIVATVLLPQLWLDPLGALTKIAPIVLLNLTLLAIREER